MLDAPPEVFDAIVALLEEQAEQQKRDDMKARLKSKVR